MKKHLLLLPLLALAAPVAAQHTELSGRAGLGLMQFGGKDAAYTSQINYSNYNGTVSGYTNSPYGSRLGVGFDVGGRVQRVGQRHTLLALDLGYDWLQSRTGISTLNYYDGSSNTPRPATGTSALRSQHLTSFLALGHRFGGSTVAVDVLLGPELAFVYGFHDKGSGTYDGGTAWSTDRPGREFNRFDGRLRADATAWKAQLGFNASYSYGCINYQGGLVGGSREVYARVLRLGLAYRLR
ncbi:hypothetical protein [Hymenobacter terricola]|uniref:hypothetical protein n=1 Tax=Hymenobacter terricola TaxID=2819236 RepID=UPI001B3112BE|nr:hypothetical protein [Hymenobacter terricola]